MPVEILRGSNCEIETEDEGKLLGQYSYAEIEILSK